MQSVIAAAKARDILVRCRLIPYPLASGERSPGTVRTTPTGTDGLLDACAIARS